ncbi:MAG: hypothetical protein ACLQJR_05165 [Stellaceae bacterium]
MPKAGADHTPIALVSPLHNLALDEVVDQLGHVKAEAAEIKSREDTLKAELVARGVTEAEGALFRATVSEGTRWTLDTQRVREDMGELWTLARSKVSAVTTVRVSARTGAKRAA